LNGSTGVVRGDRLRELLEVKPRAVTGQDEALVDQALVEQPRRRWWHRSNPE
jgi:hypothetical protein